MQKLCPTQTKCGHSVCGHLTEECSSKRNDPVPIKCASCDGNHRASSEKCWEKEEAQKAAKEALAICQP